MERLPSYSLYFTEFEDTRRWLERRLIASLAGTDNLGGDKRPLPVGDALENAEPLYRLITTILDPETAPADELAALYQERWQIETAFDELKTHLRGARIVLRSRTPDLAIQEFYGLLMAHFAVRQLMHDAALTADEDPNRLSFLHAVRVIRRKLPQAIAIPPETPDRIP